MENKELNLIVLKYFQNLKKQYSHDVEVEWDGEEMGSTILVEDYLVPFLYNNINNVNVMEALADMLEEILTYNDDYCEEVLYCAFFEKIHYDNMEEKFVCYYKENAMKFYKSISF